MICQKLLETAHTLDTLKTCLIRETKNNHILTLEWRNGKSCLYEAQILTHRKILVKLPVYFGNDNNCLCIFLYHSNERYKLQRNSSAYRDSYLFPMKLVIVRTTVFLSHSAIMSFVGDCSKARSDTIPEQWDTSSFIFYLL